MTIDEMLDRMTWLGHDTFRIDGSKTVFFDPYNLKAGAKADLVLVTHEHFDHCSPDDVDKLLTPDTVVVTEKDSAKKLTGTIQTLTPGGSLTVDHVRIEAVPAYNIGKNFHPREKGWLGFVVEMDGVRIYHAGDTDFIPEMRDLTVDIALLPVSGTYVMTVDEAVQAALAIAPGVAVPMHYGAIVGDSGNAEDFKKKLKGKVEVRIL